MPLKPTLKTMKGGLRPKIPRPGKPKAGTLTTEPELMIIQGQEAMSKEEYYVSIALDKLGLDYSYQYRIGAAGTRGAQRLDFLVYTPGRWTVVDVRGRYWHTGTREDELDLERVITRKRWRLVVAWDTDVPSSEQALIFLRQELGA